MNKLNLILIIALVFMINSINVFAASAASNASVFGNETADWRPYNSNLTLDNSTYSVTIVNTSGVHYEPNVKQVGSASAFFPGGTSTGIINYTSYGTSAYNISMLSGCVTLWTNATVGAGSFGVLVGRKDSATSDNQWAIQFDQATSVIRGQYWKGGIATHATMTNAAYTDTNTWKFLAFAWNLTTNTDIYLFANGTQQATATITGITNTPITISFTIGGDNGANNGVLAGIDEVHLINGSANCHSDNIMTIYQQGRQGLDYNSTGAGGGGGGGNLAAINITLSAINYYDGTSISNFTAILSNAANNITFTTANGTIPIANITEGFYNITFRSNQSGGYFNNTYFNFNVSQNTLQGQLYQSIVYLNVSDILNAKITSFWGKVPLQNNISNSTGWAKMLLNTGTYILGANSTGYIEGNVNITITALQTFYTNITIGTANLTVTATSSAGVSLPNFTIYLSDQINPYNLTITTTNYSIVFKTLASTYLLNFTSNGYSNSRVSLLISSGNTLPNYTFSVATTNSINFTVYDEAIGKSMKLNTSTVHIELSSDAVSVNQSTSNGSLFLDMLLPADYRITYYADNYRKRNYYFTLSNNSNNTIDLYLLSIGNGTLVTFTLQDESSRILPGALLKLLRYYVDLNAYVQVASEKADAQGLAVIDVDFNNAFYQTSITSGSTTQINPGTKIYSTTPTVTVTLGTNPFVSISKLNAISTSISFNNDSQTFSYTFTNPSGVNVNGILNVIYTNANSQSKVCNITTTTSSGTLLCNVNTSLNPGTYTANGYIQFTTSSSQYLTATANVVTGYVTNAAHIFSNSGVLLSIIFAGTLAGLGAVNPAMSIIMFLFGLAAMVFAGFTYLTLGIYVLFAAMGLFIVYKLRT